MSALVLGALVAVAEPAAAAVPTYTVSTTADVSTSTGACGNASITTAPSPLSLREATCLATNVGAGTVNINVPAGHYTLANGELTPGKAAGSTVNLTGAGAASTIIDGANASRVLDLDSQLVGGVNNSLSSLTITGGADSTFGGAAIIGGSNHNSTSDALTLTNVVVSNNVANGARPGVTNKPGGGVQFLGGKLTITNSTISNNGSRSSYGSGVAYGANGDASPEGLSITNTTFSGNYTNNTNGDPAISVGGALALFGTASSTFTVANSRFINNSATSDAASGPSVGAAIWEQSGNLTVTESTFTGNVVSGGVGVDTGGAVEVDNGTATLHYNRFTGNVAPTGSAVNSYNSPANLTDNWWGCNTGPGGTGCDSVSTRGTGTATSAPRLVLSGTASPTHVIGPNGTATLTGSLVSDSAGVNVGASNLDAFQSLPLTFSDPPGDATVTSAPGPHSAAITSGQASIDYHSGTTLGPDPTTVTLDNATVTVPLEVDQAPAITSPATVHFDVGQYGSFTVTTTGYPSAAISEPDSLPAGLTFQDNGDGTATLSGTPNSGAGTSTLHLTANNGISPNATQTLTVTVGQPPAVTSPSAATFRIGTAGSFTVTTSGIPTVSTITRSGLLPAGLGFQDNGNGTATIDGTPTGTGGTYAITLTATNGVSPNATQTLTIQVNQAPAVTTNPTDQTVQPGSSVTFTAAAGGVPTPTVQWQRSTDGGASFANIPGATSTGYTFTAAAGDNGNQYRAVFVNSSGNATTTAATLNVGSAPAFTSDADTTFVVGQAGSFTATVSGVPTATISHTGTAFPAWLTLHDLGDGTATLSGTPPAGSGGVYEFTLKAANGFSPSATQNFSLFVDQSPVITSADHATFTAGSAGTFIVTTTAGYPTATTLTSSGRLPSGMTFTDHHDGTAVLAGAPDTGAGGDYPITITATATGGSAAPDSQSFDLTVTEAPRFTSPDLATFAVGTSGTFAVTTAAAYPTTTTVTESGSLPAGVTFTPGAHGTATIAGTPDVGSGGTYVVTLTASNGIAPDAEQTFTLTVTEPPHIISADQATFTVGKADAFTVTTSPAEPAATTISCGCTAADLPAGVTFTDNHDGTATLGGTPTDKGVFTVTVTAGNGVLPDSTQAFTLTVQQPPSITSDPAATFTVGQSGSFTVTTSAGYPAATTVAKTGDLPDGVSFVPQAGGTATLAGTPAKGTGGTYAVTLTADNGIAPAAQQNFVITVDEAPQITSDDHATFTVDTAGTFTVTTDAGYPAHTSVAAVGALPAGVTFADDKDGTATLGGTPTQGGVFTLTLTASNTSGAEAEQTFTLTVDQAPAVTSADHATFAVGSKGSFTVTTTPGTPSGTTIAENGGLPNGVTLVDQGDGTATLAGTPTPGSGGRYGFDVVAANPAGNISSQAFTLTVTDLPAVTSVDTATFTVGQDGLFTVTTSAGYPTDTSVSEDGDLPDGLTFTDNHDGTATLTGTPAAGSAGTYPVTVKAANTVGATTAKLTVAVALVAQSVHFTSTPPSPAAVVGQTYTPVATGGGSGNPVTFSIDPLSSAVCMISGTTVDLQHPGTCTVDAHQDGDGTYSAGDAVQTVTVMQAATGTVLSVGLHSITATVTPVAPGAGVPTGQVTFSVGGQTVGEATLADGSATLAYTVGTGQTQTVAAAYAGDTDFAGSSASTARKDPTITATVSSPTAKSRYGWYRSPVTVTFHCTTAGADLTAHCPAPVVLGRSAGGQSVSRTITATDGGIATVVVRGLNIDRVAPQVAVTGVRNGATYLGRTPTARCSAKDPLSGIATCTLTRRTAGDAVSVTATATDRAGNRHSTTLRYTAPHFYLAGAAYVHGAFQVKEGRSYVLVALVASNARPRFYTAAPDGRPLRVAGNLMHRSGTQDGLHRYTLTVRIDRGLGRYRYWQLGVKSGSTMHRVRFHPLT